MSATTNRHAVGRRLRELRRGPGNWRTKGLLLALAGGVDAADVGREWPRDAPQTTRDYVNLGRRDGDTYEHNVVRELYGKDAITEGETVAKDDLISRALVQGSPANLDVVWREELLDTVQRGADIRRNARNAATVHDVGTSKGDLPVEDETPFAQAGSSGAEAAFDEADTTNLAYATETFEQGFALEDELIDQGEVDVLEYQIRRAGEGVENRINRQAINHLLDNGTTYDADLSGSGNTDARDLLLKAQEKAADEDFDPTDSVVMHPEYESELFGNNQALGVSGGDNNADYVALAHEFFTQSGTAYTGSNTYGFESDGEFGALVFGRQFVHIPVFREVEVSELQPPFTAIHDLQGGVARAATDTVAVDPDDDGTLESVVVVQR